MLDVVSDQGWLATALGITNLIQMVVQGRWLHDSSLIYIFLYWQTIVWFQAMLDVVSDQGWLATALGITNLIQMVVQGRWLHDSSLLTLPHFMPYHVFCMR